MYIMLINQVQVPLNLQQSPRARLCAVNLPFLPREFIGLIQTVGPTPTRSRLTVTWRLMEEAGL